MTGTDRDPGSARPVFLLGSQRCGTTALSYALSSAYDRAGGHFTVNGKLPYLLDRWLTADDLAHRHLRADEILHALDRRPPDGDGVARWRAQAERALRDAARDVAEGSAGAGPEAARALGARVMARSYEGFDRWGDKYNEYLLHLPGLAGLVPDARYVMLVRHPEEAARSMLRWTGDRPWRPSTREAALAKWTEWNARWLGFAPGVPGADRLVIEYHALCRGEETDRLEEFLQLSLAPQLTGLEPRSAAHDPAAADGQALPGRTAAVWAALTDMT